MNSRISKEKSMDYPTNFDKMAKVLLIGETGSGKSTLINYLFNYFHQGDLNNLKIAIPCKYHPFATGQFSYNEFNISDTTQSKTNTCTQYVFTDPTTEKQYLFLDTPGLSDTRGVEQNEINITKMMDAITQLGNLSTVIIVVNGSISRLTTYFRSVIASLNGNLPDIILENAIVVLTNAKKHESPFDLRVLNLNGNVYPFYMQNNAFVSDPHTWKCSIFDELQLDWNHSMKQIQQILQTIDSFKQTSIEAFMHMKQIRNDIKYIIHQARLEILRIQKIENEQSQLDSVFQQANRDVATYENHRQFQTIEKIEIVDAPYHSTLCLNCHQVCHDNCRLNETKSIGAQIFSHCTVMINGQCQQCSNHCSYVHHYHAKKTIRITRETIEDVLMDFQNRYDQATATRNSYQEKMFSVSETKNLLQKALEEKIEQLKRKSSELSHICSSFNLAHELKYLIKHYKTETALLSNLETKLENEQFIKTLVKLTRAIADSQEKTSVRKQTSMQIIYQDVSCESKPKEISNLKTSDLIELYYQTADRTLLHSISEELHRRAQGKSAGPLLTAHEIILTNKFFEKYKQKTVYELSYAYRKIQNHINTILNSNILKIIDIDPELLIENFILQTLLDEKEKDENNHQNTFVESMHSASLPYPTQDPLPSPLTTTNMNSPLIGFAHIVSTPYPKSNEGSPLPSLPLDNNMPPHHSPNNDKIQTGFRLEDYRYNPTDSRRLSSSLGYPDSPMMPMPMLMNNQQRLSSTQKSNVGFSFQNTIDCPSIPDVVPSNHSSFNSPKTQRNQLTTAELDTEKFRSIDNARLLLMYANAILREKDTQQHAIYNELYQRCFGDNPLLIKQNKHLLEEKIKLHEHKTIEELLRARTSNKQKIRQYIPNDDVTLIDDIPVGLLIEANALNQLILAGTQS